MHRYSQEEIDWLKENVPGRPWKDVTKLFNKRFNTDLSMQIIRAVAKRHKINNGVDSKFKKGQVPFNKGMKGVNFGGVNGEKTQFKKGRMPVNHRPVGSERVSVFGYIEIKVAEPKTWRMKHQVIWEEANGPIPKGHVIIFGDGNKLNCDINNLLLISRKKLVRMNQNHLIKDDIELTKTGIVIADIIQKIHDRKKETNK